MEESKSRTQLGVRNESLSIGGARRMEKDKGSRMAKPVPEEEESPELKELYQYVGQRVRSLREGKKMSQKDLASRSGMRQPYLAEIELLGVNLSLKLLHRLAAALELSPRDLLPGAGTTKDYETVLRTVRDYVKETEPTVRSLAAHYASLVMVLDRERRSEDSSA